MVVRRKEEDDERGGIAKRSFLLLCVLFGHAGVGDVVGGWMECEGEEKREVRTSESKRVRKKELKKR